MEVITSQQMSELKEFEEYLQLVSPKIYETFKDKKTFKKIMIMELWHQHQENANNTSN